MGVGASREYSDSNKSVKGGGSDGVLWREPVGGFHCPVAQSLEKAVVASAHRMSVRARTV